MFHFMISSSLSLFRKCQCNPPDHQTICANQIYPISAGSYPTVSSHSGEWSLDPNSHSLAWSTPLVSVLDNTRSGSLIFTVGGDDPGAFFPVKVTFNGQGSLAGIDVASISKVGGGDNPAFSVDASVTAEEYLVV